MLALIAALMIASPPAQVARVVHPDECDGQVICRFVPRGGRACTCEPDVISLGEIDVRPAPGDWPTTSYYNTEPAAWGTYPTEKIDP